LTATGAELTLKTDARGRLLVGFPRGLIASGNLARVTGRSYTLDELQHLRF
jgi:hypothetical protein